MLAPTYPAGYARIAYLSQREVQQAGGGRRWGEEDFLAVFQLCPAGRPSIASPAGPALGSA
jgi:hypothetical protein